MDPRALVRLLPVPAALALLVTACGDGDEEVTGAGNGPPTASPTAAATSPPAPSPDTSPTATQDATGETVEVTVVGEGISFDVEQVTVPVGAEVTMTFENRDEGIPHNLHVLGLEEQTQVEPGPVTQTLTFTPTEAGTYDFRCDVHPAQMTGELVVQ